MRIIDADALKASIEEKDRYNLGGENRIIVCGMLDDAPTIDAVPVKHGRWEQCCNLMGEYFKCSECGYKAEVPTCMGEPIYIFCPNCGAKMDEKHEGKSADVCFIDEPGNPRYV